MRPFDALDGSVRRSPEHDGLLTWALGSLHATLLVGIVVAIAYLGGGLPSILEQTRAVFGVLLFAVIWVAALWTARRALRAVLPRPGRPLPPFHEVLYEAANWGGVAGAIVLAAVTLPVALVLLLDIVIGDRGAPSIGTLGAGVLGVVLGLSASYAIGAVVGALFASLDRALLALARRLA